MIKIDYFEFTVRIKVRDSDWSNGGCDFGDIGFDSKGNTVLEIPVPDTAAPPCAPPKRPPQSVRFVPPQGKLAPQAKFAPYFLFNA